MNEFTNKKTLSKKEYLEVFGDIAQKIENNIKNIIVVPTRSVKYKNTFGDVDIVLSRKVSMLELHAAIGFDISQNNQPVIDNNLSMYKGYQLDFLFADENSFEFTQDLNSYEIFGYILPKIAGYYDLKVSNKGLSIRISHPLNANLFKDVLLTSNSQIIFDFLGFDHQLFVSGFYDNEDFYNYLVTSNYYNNELFTKPTKSSGKLENRITTFIQWKKDMKFMNHCFDLDKRLKQFFDTKVFCLKELDNKYSELEIKKILLNDDQNKSSVREYVKDIAAKLRIDNIDLGRYLSDLLIANQEEYKC